MLKVSPIRNIQHTGRAIEGVVLLQVLVLVLVCSAASTSATADDPIGLQLAGDRLLTRLRRQASQTQASQPGNRNQDGTQPADSATNEEKPPEEVLSSLKCDFGSSDAPDLCKFKIIEASAQPDSSQHGKQQASPLFPTWTLGSGKLALFQGGPLVDSSQGNDTNGGYIFYETSSSAHLAAGSAQSSNQVFNSSANRLKQHDDYSSAIVSFKPSAPYKSSHEADERPLFQQYASARISVGAQQVAPPQAAPPSVVGPTFASPNLTAPGPSGMCLSFQYAIQGLSAEELRIFVLDHKSERARLIWTASESASSNWTKGEVLYSVAGKHSILFSATTPQHNQRDAATAKDLQQRKFRGYVALDDIEANKHEPTELGACRGHCNFDGDLCGWTNGENGQEDNFDWSFGRGSDNLFTGPARDFTSSSNVELTGGSYLFTPSGFPRRPGDRAVLASPIFEPTLVNEVMCMRLAVHMFGSGIGSLAIKIRYTDESPAAPTAANLPGGGAQPAAAGPASAAAPSAATNQQQSGTGQATGGASGARFSSAAESDKQADLAIWELSGDAGNSWHQAQTSVSSSKSAFQVLIEGTIGENHLGNIAIDEISFSQGACPTSPPLASKNYGDCTFEHSMCYWRNPDADIHLDDLDWVRTADEQSIHGPNFDHTLKKRSGSYLKLENTFREPKSGTRAFLLSPIFQPKASGSVQCLSFYYYMFMRSIGSSGPSLGTIRVYLASNNELVPIWRLTNPISSPSWKHARASLSTALVDGQPIAPTKLFQIAFEGIWGDAQGGAIALDDITIFDGACDILPQEAKSVPGECTFDTDMCSWANKTYEPQRANTGGALSPVSPADGSTDSNRSPFLQSVGTAGGQQLAASGHKQASWQLATVDSRPVNLQDHTYKAPIGYAYVDVLDAIGGQSTAFPLQSAEVTVQQGQQVLMCLSFWFAAYGRQDSNQLEVYLTQASAPPQPAEQDVAAAAGPGKPVATRGQAATGGASGGMSPPGAAAGAPEAESENANAWKLIDGKLLWSMSLKNVTETNRRKWLYGQVTLKADSNHIVRFVAVSNDGGFALDDISYFDGSCETRPAQARVLSAEEEAAQQEAPASNQPSPPK